MATTTSGFLTELMREAHRLATMKLDARVEFTMTNGNVFATDVKTLEVKGSSTGAIFAVRISTKGGMIDLNPGHISSVRYITPTIG